MEAEFLFGTISAKTVFFFTDVFTVTIYLQNNLTLGSINGAAYECLVEVSIIENNKSTHVPVNC